MSKNYKKKYKKMKARLREAVHATTDLMLITKSVFDSSFIENIEEVDGEYRIDFQDHTGVAVPIDNDGTKEGIMLNLLYGVLAQIYRSEEMADRVFEVVQWGAEVFCELPEDEEEIYERFASSVSPEDTEDDVLDNASEDTSSLQSETDIYSKVKKLTQKEIEHPNYRTIDELTNQLGVTEETIREFFTDDFCKKYLRLTPDNVLVIKGDGCGLIKSSINNNDKGE